MFQVRPDQIVVRIPLEDNFTDVLGKAQRGLKLAHSELARRAGVRESDLSSALQGVVNEPVLRKLAGALGLGAPALSALANESWSPIDPGSIAGLKCFTEPYGATSVNSYLVSDAATHEAAMFDTGVDCSNALRFASQHGLRISLLLLTHAHEDHVADLEKLTTSTNAQAWASDREPVPGARSFPDRQQFEFGGLTISTRRTSGHARGGVTYLVTGLARPLAIVGDAIFAGSMGGGMVNYQEALRTNRESLFTLLDETVVCPGHGPMTTVGEERVHNPFFSSISL